MQRIFFLDMFLQVYPWEYALRMSLFKTYCCHMHRKVLNIDHYDNGFVPHIRRKSTKQFIK